jgi:hypothetical protein
MPFVAVLGMFPKLEKDFPSLFSSLHISWYTLNFESIGYRYWYPCLHLYSLNPTWEQNAIDLGQYFIEIGPISESKERNNPSSRHLNILHIRWCNEWAVVTYTCFFVIVFWRRFITIKYLCVNTNNRMAFSEFTAY